ncbi:MAG: hypothetical protein IPL65_13575 [Lewinellaceae bacterium]|nr:hypothetical protein [Lewinellaceae bacterium]
MNIFYIGVDNPVHIAVNGLRNDEWTPKLKGEGKIIGENGNYNVLVTRPGSVFIEIYKNDQLLSSTEYRVKRVPDPVPMLAGRKSSTVSKKELLKSGFVLHALLENFEFDAQCQVVESQVTLVPHRGEPSYPERSQGAVFSEKKVAEILALPDSSMIFIDDIKVKCPGDAAARNMGGLAFRIVDE